MHVNFFNDEKNMKNKYWKYICLLGLGAFCWACSDDNPDGGQNSGDPGSEGGHGTEQEITRSYKLGTLAGWIDLTPMPLPCTTAHCSTVT